MKFQELKDKFKSKYTMRMVAGILCVVLAGGSVSAYKVQGEKVVTKAEEQTYYAKQGEDKEVKKGKETKKESLKEESLKEESLAGKLLSALHKNTKEQENLDGKEETVYVIADANGKATQTIVSNWLKNGSASAQIADESSLSEIENVKGDETFSQSGSQLTWQANGEDIYYKGTTTEETPITEAVTYYLNGNEIAPQDLAGKSGHVTIRFDYENHAKTMTTIHGKKEEICVPFTIMSGMIFDDSFRNVQVNHGRVLSDGDRKVVVGFAMPGLQASLDVDESDFDEDIAFPDYIEVSADVEDFALEMTVTVAMTGFLSDMDLAGSLDLSELDETMDDLQDAMGQLKNGGGELADGLNTLHHRMGEFTDGISSLKDGVDAYTDGASQLAEGIQTLNDSSGTLETGVQTLNSSAKTISDGVQKLDDTLHTQMTEKEKQAAMQQVDAAIDAQFQEGSAAYQMIYTAATQNFTNTMTNDAAVQSVQAGIQAGMQSQGLTSDGVIAALAQYYEANGFTDASGQSYAPEVCQSTVPGTETTYAAYFASAVLNGGLSSALAGGITNGIASQGASAVGTSVVSACETAAKQAGESAALTSIQSTKEQIATAIEQKDAASGYSLVTGAKALSQGTQQLEDNLPSLKNGIGQLLTGAKELVSNNAALKDGVIQLSDGTGKITDGVVKLNDGAKELSNGLRKFDKQAISKITDAYNGDIKDLTERIKAVIQAGDDYGTFCGAADGVQATTKFIFRTDSVTTKENE